MGQKRTKMIKRPRSFEKEPPNVSRYGRRDSFESSRSKKKGSPVENQRTGRFCHEENDGGILKESLESLSPRELGRLTYSPREDVSKFYEVFDVIGAGAFSTVKKGKNRKTGEEVAVKIFHRDDRSFREESVRREIKILLTLKHPSIVDIKNLFYDEKNVFLVMEYVDGGELFDDIQKKPYSEDLAKTVMRQIVNAVKYLHSENVVHRDIKLDNILLSKKIVKRKKDEIHKEESTGRRAKFKVEVEIKLTDFGLSILTDGSPVDLKTHCGSPCYVAPEVLSNSGYDSKVDVWSVGVVMYVVLCGYLPFDEDTIQDTYMKILRGEFKFHEKYWREISREAKGLIKKMLTVNPEKRIDVDRILWHKWFKEGQSEIKEQNKKENEITQSLQEKGDKKQNIKKCSKKKSTIKK